MITELIMRWTCFLYLEISGFYESEFTFLHVLLASAQKMSFTYKIGSFSQVFFGYPIHLTYSP